MAVSGAHDIPRVRRHEPSLIHGNSERLRHGPVRLGGRLEAPHRVHGERSLEERGAPGIHELLLHAAGAELVNVTSRSPASRIA